MSYFEAGSENTDFLRRLGFLAPCRRRNFRIPSGRRFIVRPPIRMILPHRANPIDPPRHLILRITGLNLHFLRKNHLSRIPSDQKTKVPKCCQYRRYQIGPSGYPPFDPLITADPPKPASYSDDITLPHYVASNRICAGEQRKGAHYNLPDATSRTDHVERAVQEPFYLADEIPLPPDVTRAMDFIPSTPDKAIRTLWRSQLSRLRSLVKGGGLSPNQFGTHTARIPSITPTLLYGRYR